MGDRSLGMPKDRRNIRVGMDKKFFKNSTVTGLAKRFKVEILIIGTEAPPPPPPPKRAGNFGW